MITRTIIVIFFRDTMGKKVLNFCIFFFLSMTSFDAFTIELGHLTVNGSKEKKCLENVIKLLIFESKNLFQ